MEAFASVINVLLERHLIPTVVGFVIASIVYYCTPEKSAVLERLGAFWYVLLLTAIVFLIISFIQYLITKNKLVYYYLNRKRMLQSMWNIIDDYNPQEKKFLMRLISSGNPETFVLEEDTADFYSMDIKDSDMFLCTQPIEYADCDDCFICRLNPKYYKLLKYSLGKYGRICNLAEKNYVLFDDLGNDVQ